MKKKGVFIKSTIFSILVLSLILSATLSFGAVFCVKNATELQDALTTAAANIEDDTIQMVQGVYSGPFVSSTLYEESLALEGGYTEDCTSREIDPRNTILDGGGISRCLRIYQRWCDVSIEGVTFQNGKASVEQTSNGLLREIGGGLYVSVGGNLVLTDNIFTGNTAEYGGGAYVDLDDGSAVFTNNIFSGNTATEFHGMGGGLAVSGSATLTKNTFADNRATGYGGYGGGVYISGSATLADNIFTGNAAIYDEDLYAGDSAAEYTDRIGPTWSNGYGGGVSLSGSATLINNTFTDNIAAGHNRGGGGGVYIHGSAVITNNTFEDNTGTGYRDSGGGGVYVYGPATVTKNRFTNNTGPDYLSLDSGGGGVCVTGSATLADNVFAGNTSNQGGGVYISISDDSAILTNNTLTANIAETEGGGVWLLLKNDDCQGFLYNNIIWNNTAPEAADIYIDNTDDDPLSPVQTAVYNNDFDRSPTGIHIAVPFEIDSSNLDNEDPLFVENGDYHLTEFSPCVDAGDNEAPDLPETDMDGNPRIVNGVVDIGAYEYRPSVSAPKTITGSATSLSSFSVTLNGLVNANGASSTVVFEYGTDTSYGGAVTAAQSPLTGTDDHDVSADLTRLIPNTTYQFRVKATNSLGTTYGDNRSFSTTGPTSFKPCYQFYNPTWVDHHFTIDEEEAALLKDNPEWGWEYVRVSWYAFEGSEAGKAELAVGGFELKPCHQFFNPTWVDHHFTIDEEEAALLKANPQWGWEYVGISWYALPESEAERAEFVVSGFELKPCYQFYNPTWVDHHFTIDEEEAALLKDNPEWGWEYVRISWYVYVKSE